jgi:hypothetical protein
MILSAFGWVKLSLLHTLTTSELQLEVNVGRGLGIKHHRKKMWGCAETE